MALNKLIVQSDGIETNYHRIVKLEIVVNQYNYVEVVSYVNADARNRQRNFESLQTIDVENNLSMPYRATKIYEFPYDESMTIKDAYNELKKQLEFAGATDILEEGQTSTN